MNRAKPSFAARVRTEVARCYVGPATLAQDTEEATRISSLKPHVVVLGAAIIAATAIGFATKQLLDSGHVPWTLLTLGIAHAVVALAGFVMWKCVRSGARHYVVSNFIKSERISLDDVCMVVQDRGLIWNRVHIHFRRPTRFGWSVSYVAVPPTRSFASLLVPWQRRRPASAQLADES